MLTKEQIEQKIADLEKERDQAKTNFIAYEGAIQMNRQWLTEIDKVNEQDNTQPSS